MKSQEIKRSFYKRTLSILAVNLGILCLLLLFAEVTLRIARIPYKEDFIPSENAVAQFDKDLGWAYIPNISKTLRFGANERTLHFDRNGIRVPAPDFQLSSQRPSILFIGCSFTMGHGLSYEESFPAQFAALTNNAYQTVNLGVQAYGTDQALLALKKFTSEFNTKVVVYTFIEDHIIRNGNYDRRYLYPAAKVIGTKPLFSLDRNQKPYLAKPPLLYKNYRNSYLYDLLNMRLESMRKAGPPYPEKLTKALIREMSQYCRERNIHFMLINWRWHDYDYDNASDLRGDAAIEIIDTRENAPGGWADMQIPGENHPNAEAGMHVARLLQTHFKKKSLLDQQ